MAKTQEAALTKVSYAPSRDIVTLHLATGARVDIPRVLIKELRRLSESDLRSLEPRRLPLASPPWPPRLPGLSSRKLSRRLCRGAARLPAKTQVIFLRVCV
jgi:hypothetical protein